jgi:hypothetical protein
LSNYYEVPYTPTAAQQAEIEAFDETAFREDRPWIPETSTIGPLTASKLEIEYNISDKIDVALETDATIAETTWVTFDFVSEIESFDPLVPSWPDASSSSWIKKLEFKTGGNLIWNDNHTDKWTKDFLLMASGSDTASKYEIRDFSGTDYMFVENKNGDYSIRAQKPYYFVLVKQQQQQ